MRFWIGVASREHVKIGEAGGFCQLCHGKEGPLRRMKRGDYIVYYSSKKHLGDREAYRQFTAIGEIADDTVYRFEMFEGFVPFRRNVAFWPSLEVPVQPLIGELSFISDKRRWGYPFRYGHLEISKEDFLLIAERMLCVTHFNQLKEELSCRQ